MEAQRHDSLDKQVGGEHYKSMSIQPVEFIAKNQIPFMEGCIIKYASRHRGKGNAEDIRKIKHFCDLILKLEYGQES